MREPTLEPPTPEPPTPDAPAAPEGRLASIDILRGFALLGILLVNMLFFAYPAPYYPAMSTPGLSAIDRAAEWAVRVFAQSAFYTIFAFLFGLGFALQLRRLAHRLTIYGRRLAVLFAFGLLHSVLLWTGDILMSYALVGALLLPFRESSGRSLLLLGLAGILVSSWLFWQPLFLAERLGVPQESRAAITASYAAGGYLEVTGTRLLETINRLLGTLYGLPRFLALFMLGLWVGRHLQSLPRHLPLLRRLALVLLLVGAAGKALYGYNLLTGAFGPEGSRLVQIASMNLSGPALGLAYLSGLFLLLQQSFWRRRLAPLAAVGRMALTNYLLQSLVFTTIFYGYGLGLYGQIGMAWGLPLAVAVYALQIPFSVLWLRSFRFGPAEWLWRTLTYGSRPPMRKQLDPA